MKKATKLLALVGALAMSLSLGACSKDCKDMCNDCSDNDLEKDVCEAMCKTCTSEIDALVACADDNGDICDSSSSDASKISDKCSSEQIDYTACMLKDYAD